MKLNKYITIYIIVGVFILFTGCNDNKNSSILKDSKIELNGKNLLKLKCSKCHNINFPPENFDNELAPPMMTISFHFNDWFKGSGSTEKLENQLNFISDYIINPTIKKSYCDKTMLNKYGLMPSQKGNVTINEIRAIGEYLFQNYTPQNLAKKQEALDILHAKPKGEQLTIQYHCISCHKIDKNLVGPSFKSIANKYKINKNSIINSIKNGSRTKWQSSHGATMPPFRNISADQLNIIADWIIKI